MAVDGESTHFVSVGADAYRLQAELRFGTVRALRPEGTGLIRSASSGLTVDLSGVSQADSAGLALLVDWLAVARAAGKSLRYLQIPPALQALSQLSEVQPLLQGGAGPGLQNG